MSIHAHESMFSADYGSARARFRSAAQHRGLELQTYEIEEEGPLGEPLAIDVATSPDSNANAENALVLSSGLHGVEAPLGAAIQMALLERWNQMPFAGGAMRAVLIHVLNPFGFAWSRRVDCNNVDLNRNFVLDERNYQGSPAGYAQFNPLLNPERPPSDWDLFYVRAAWAVARHGMAAMKQSLATGQYDFPHGLFFGGHGPSPTLRILRQHLPQWLGHTSRVVHLDFHTGLGAWGTCKLLVDYALQPAQRQWLVNCFGADSYEENDASGTAYPARGGWGQWCVSQQFAANYLFAIAEFGTYGVIPVLAGLRAENQAHLWAQRNDPRTVRAKQRLRELFCPASPDWRTRNVAFGLDLIERSLKGL